MKQASRCRNSSRKVSRSGNTRVWRSALVPLANVSLKALNTLSTPPCSNAHIPHQHKAFVQNGDNADNGNHADRLLVHWLTAGENTTKSQYQNLKRSWEVVWSSLLSRWQAVLCQIPFHWVNQFLLWTCVLSEVSKVTKFIEGGDGHLFEDEDIKRLLQGG